MKNLPPLFLILALICVILVSCSSGESPYKGMDAQPVQNTNAAQAINNAEADNMHEWIPVPSQWSDSYTGIFLDFTGEGSLHYIQNGTELWVSCEIADDRLTIRYDAANTEEAAYRLEGDILTVIWQSGGTTTLTRQDGQ